MQYSLIALAAPRAAAAAAACTIKVACVGVAHVAASESNFWMSRLAERGMVGNPTYAVIPVLQWVGFFTFDYYVYAYAWYSYLVRPQPKLTWYRYTVR